MRINKFLSTLGIASRRTIDKYIEEGRITVNGNTAITGMDISENDNIFIDGKKIETNIDEEKVYFIDEIREVTRKFNGKKNDYREISKEENNLTKIQYDKLKLIISNFNNGKESVEKALVGRKHKLFVMLDKLDLIIKKGDKLLNGINSVSDCSME